jgi:AcrR family transcriptional regulator
MRKDIKNQIIDATIVLIEENGSNTDNITIQNICDRVGIGSGLVNYHFQTKENLIAQCVQKIIGDVIGKLDTIYNSLKNMTSEESLRFMAKSTCSYLVSHESISRISILTDLNNSSLKDNTAQTVSAYFPLIRKVCPDSMSDQAVKEKIYLLTLTLQAVFMRSNSLEEEIGIDFHDEQQRAKFVDKVIDSCGFKEQDRFS